MTRSGNGCSAGVLEHEPTVETAVAAKSKPLKAEPYARHTACLAPSMNHLSVLRASLLLAIGVVPLACGATTSRGKDDDADSGSGGGGNPRAGMSSGGTTAGALTGLGGTAGNMVPPTAGGPSGGTTQTTPTCTAGKLDRTTGLVHCQEGYHHRAEKVDCGSHGGVPASAGASNADPKPRATGTEPCGEAPVGGPPRSENCDEFELGYCSQDEGTSYPITVCYSGCGVDEDCGKGYVCECGHPESPSGGVCVPTDNCHTDAECLPGFFCATHVGSCSGTAYACLTPNDRCRSSDGCAASEDCEFGTEGPFRSCQEALECSAGR